MGLVSSVSNPPASGAADRDERVLRARLDLVVETFPITLIVNPFWAAVFAVPMMGLVPTIGVIEPWRLALAVFLHFATGFAALLVQRAYVRNPANPRLWLLIFVAIQGAMGAAWGASAWLFWETGNAVNNVLVAVLFTGIIWSYAITRTMHMAVFVAGVAATSVLYFVRLATGEGEVAQFLTLISPIWLGYVLFMAVGQQQRVQQLLEARFAREDLAVELGSARDEAISQRNEAEAANLSKTAFLANMSHELRTPLNAILGFSEIIAGQALGQIGDKRYAEYANDIHSSGRHLLSLINDLLDVAKIEAGRMEVDPRPVEPVPALESALTYVRVKANEKNIHISGSVARDIPPLYADDRALRQILLNLLSNAVKYTQPGGRVDVQFRRGPAGEFEIVVSDNGPGIPRARQAMLFKPFAQTDNRYNRRAGSTGLGLALVRGLVELHGGRAWLVSEEGAGTKVFVSLPVPAVATREKMLA